jgi:hypothetical protein
MNLWDSIQPKQRPRNHQKGNRQKSKSHFPRDVIKPLKNQEAKARISTLWDASETKS